MVKLSKPQVQGLFNFLGSHQKVLFLAKWCKVSVRAEELKVDYDSFRKMRVEKVLPKRLGRTARNSDDIEPFSAKQDQAIAKLIKDTFDRKESAYSKAAQDYATLSRAVSPLLTARPSLMDHIKAFCHTKVE